MLNMSCENKRGNDCFLHFDGIGIPDTCIEEGCELWIDDEDEWGMPMCPSCGEPTYDDKRCVFCGQRIISEQTETK